MMNKQCSDVLIHVDDDLSNDDIHSLENEISCMDGVYSASTNANTKHLMLVEYDPNVIRALDLLHSVMGRGLHAEFVGI